MRRAPESGARGRGGEGARGGGGEGATGGRGDEEIGPDRPVAPSPPPPIAPSPARVVEEIPADSLGELVAPRQNRLKIGHLGAAPFRDEDEEIEVDRRRTSINVLEHAGQIEHDVVEFVARGVEHLAHLT